MDKYDWTVDLKTHIGNSSELYLAIRAEIEDIIRSEGYALINGGARGTAGLILAQLAHRYGFAPVNEDFTWKAIRGEDNE